jgi:hypothetical protein
METLGVRWRPSRTRTGALGEGPGATNIGIRCRRLSVHSDPLEATSLEDLLWEVAGGELKGQNRPTDVRTLG